MSSNLSRANEYISKSLEAMKLGHYEEAAVLNDIAHTIMVAHQSERISMVAEKVDRLASILNNGRTWH